MGAVIAGLVNSYFAGSYFLFFGAVFGGIAVVGAGIAVGYMAYKRHKGRNKSGFGANVEGGNGVGMDSGFGKGKEQGKDRVPDDRQLPDGQEKLEKPSNLQLSSGEIIDAKVLPVGKSETEEKKVLEIKDTTQLGNEGKNKFRDKISKMRVALKEKISNKKNADETQDRSKDDGRSLGC